MGNREEEDGWGEGGCASAPWCWRKCQLQRHCLCGLWSSLSVSVLFYALQTQQKHTPGRSTITHLSSSGTLKLVSSVSSKQHLYFYLFLIIIIAFKGAIRDCLQPPHSAANCLQHVRSSGPGATVCKSRATHRALITCKCHVTCHLVRRDSSAIKFDIAFIWALFYWLNH